MPNRQTIVTKVSSNIYKKPTEKVLALCFYNTVLLKKIMSGHTWGLSLLTWYILWPVRLFPLDVRNTCPSPESLILYHSHSINVNPLLHKEASKTQLLRRFSLSVNAPHAPYPTYTALPLMPLTVLEPFAAWPQSKLIRFLISSWLSIVQWNAADLLILSIAARPKKQNNRKVQMSTNNPIKEEAH